MKILHTADWHLGKIVNGVHMTEEQTFILKELLLVIEREKPDVIIIAGDLYDRSIPPKEAVELLNHTLTTIITTYKIPVLAIAGNHDSPDRLEFGNKLFRAQQLYLETKVNRDMESVTIHDSHGPVHFHLIPYTEPAEVREAFQEEDVTSHQTAMETIIAHIEGKHDMDERHILIGHAFLAGGMETDSEERLSMIGGTPYVDAKLFGKFSYVAMGHLHQAQRILSDTVRYSGSILKYSFSEASHKKSVTIVDMDENGKCELSKVPLNPRRDMRVLEGFFQDLIENPQGNTEDYLHVQLLDEGQIIDPMSKLRKVYPNILQMERKTRSSKNGLLDLHAIRKKQSQSHLELFSSFYEEIKGKPLEEISKSQIDKVISKILEKERRA